MARSPVPVPLTLAGVLMLAGCSAAQPSAAPSPTSSAADAIAAALEGEQPVITFQYGGQVQVAALDAPSGAPIAPDIETGEQVHPEWSPDGTQVAFAADDDDGTRDIWVAALDGTATKVFDCTDPCAYTDDPSWHPDGDSLLFEQATKLAGDSGRYDLTSLDLTSKASTTVFGVTGSESPWAAHWSPDGTRVVAEFRHYSTASVTAETVLGTRVAVIDPGTGAVTEIAGGAAGAWEPNWSPDGQHVVFTSTAKDWEVFMVPATGGTSVQVTHKSDSGGRALQARFSQNDSTLVAVAEDTPGAEHARAALVDPATGEASVVSTFGATHPHLRPTS